MAMQEIRESRDPGSWVVGRFDPERSLTFPDTRVYRRGQLVSKATGSQWNHETLHLTASGRWVLEHWSQWQGSPRVYQHLGREAAASWLREQNYPRFAADLESPQAEGVIRSELRIRRAWRRAIGASA